MTLSNQAEAAGDYAGAIADATESLGAGALSGLIKVLPAPANVAMVMAARPICGDFDLL